MIISNATREYIIPGKFKQNTEKHFFLWKLTPLVNNYIRQLKQQLWSIPLTTQNHPSLILPVLIISAKV